MKRILLFGFLFTAALGFKPEKTLNLKIRIEGIVNDKGEICVALFAKKQGSSFPEDIENLYQYKIVKASPDGVSIEFQNLPLGTYAYSIVHDFNGNRFTDKNFAGYPTEPYGFSTNFKPLFSAPNFKDCDFVLDKDLEHTITLIQ
ncbi:MAG: DUF2141 domain-containing protein [Bacteroidia bacterium]